MTRSCRSVAVLIPSRLDLPFLFIIDCPSPFPQRSNSVVIICAMKQALYIVRSKKKSDCMPISSSLCSLKTLALRTARTMYQFSCVSGPLRISFLSCLVRKKESFFYSLIVPLLQIVASTTAFSFFDTLKFPAPLPALFFFGLRRIKNVRIPFLSVCYPPTQ